METTFVVLVRNFIRLSKSRFPNVKQVRQIGVCPRLRGHEGRREGSTRLESLIVRSSYPEVEIPNIPVHELIFQNLSSWEDKTAVVCGLSGKKLTYRQMYKSSKALVSSMMKGLGLRKGDHMAVVLPNCPEYLTVLLAASMSGIIATPINPAYTPFEVSLQLKDTDSKMIITVCEVYGKCLEALNLLKKKIPIVVTKIEKDSVLPAGSIYFDDLIHSSFAKDFKVTPIDPERDIFVLPYSSGTSGLPKGVELTHKNIMANLLQYRMVHEMKSSSVQDGTGQCSILGILPMFHIYGMVVIALDAVSEGDCLVSLPKFEPDLFIETIFQKKTSLLYLVPPLIFFLSNSSAVKYKHLAHVRYIVTGAAPCGGTDLENLLSKVKHIKTAQGYGMTETSPVITVTHKKRYHKNSSVGHPLPSTLIKVSNLDTGMPLRRGERGQICVKGPQVMKGYFNLPEETKKTFDDEGWLKTGDVGYYDEDDDFFVVDRMKELIKVKGFQVAPAELEEFLRGYPKVEDVGIIGVSHPLHGEVPKAFVVIKDGITCTADEIKNYVKENLSAHKQLSGGVVFVKEIPKSGAGKILRRSLKDLDEKEKSS